MRRVTGELARAPRLSDVFRQGVLLKLRDAGDAPWVQIPDGSQRVPRSEVRAMRIRYFEDADTLLIELRSAPVAETRDLEKRADIPQFSYERIPA